MQYEIRVRGRLGEALLASFEGLETEVEPAESILRGPVEDAAALRELLQRIEELDLELIEVKRLRE
jgi:hypothetical protein